MNHDSADATRATGQRDLDGGSETTRADAPHTSRSSSLWPYGPGHAGGDDASAYIFLRLSEPQHLRVFEKVFFGESVSGLCESEHGVDRE